MQVLRSGWPFTVFTEHTLHRERARVQERDIERRRRRARAREDRELCKWVLFLSKVQRLAFTNRKLPYTHNTS
jgi:hypothetical protein